MFVALLAPHVRTPAGRTAALVAAAVALGAVPVTAAGIPILLAVSALIPAVYVQRRRAPAARDADPGTGDPDEGAVSWPLLILLAAGLLRSQGTGG